MDQRDAPSAGTRETRLLLVTIVVSVVMLLVLARFRFPAQGHADTAEPAPAPLEILAAQVSYDELASTMTDLDRRVRPGLTRVRVGPGDSFAAAIRVTPDRAVVRLAAGQTLVTDDDLRPQIIGRDGVSGIAVISLPSEPDGVATPRSGIPRTGPRYIAVVDAAARGLALRPAYVGATTVTDDRVTGRALLSIATGPQAVTAGAPLFTFAGTFIGIATRVDGTVTVVPADVLRTMAENPPPPTGLDLGLEVQPLTDALARIAGATEGVMVAAISPGGPAAGVLAPGDVIQALDGTRISSPVDFDAFERSRASGRAVPVTFVRRGKTLSAELTTIEVAAPDPVTSDADPGLTLRLTSGRGLVLGVRDGGAAARAGVQRGDTILSVDSAGPSDLTRAFTALSSGGGLLLTIERDGKRRVVALEKR